MEELQQTWMVVFNFGLILGSNLLMRPILKLASINPDCKAIKYYNYFGISMVLFFSLFSFWGLDWFHYFESFENIKVTGESDLMEEIYVFIITYLCPHYMVFRFWVWGLATMFLIMTFKRTNINTTIALFFFISIWLIWFSYARASLAMAIQYFGAALLISEKKSNNKKKFCIGLFLILSSLAFHKSAIFGIAVILIAYFCYDGGLIMKSLPLFASLLLVGTLVIILSSLDTMALYADNERMDMMAKAGQAYMDDFESTNKTLGVKLMVYMERLPYYMMAVMSIIITFGKKYKAVPLPIRFFAYILFMEVLYASIFAFDYGFSTQTFFGRFLRFSTIPATIVLTYMYTEKKIFWLVRYTYMIGFLGVLYNLFYITLTTS